MSAASPRPRIGFEGYHSVEICVKDAKPWIDYFTKGFGFQYTARSTPEYENTSGKATHLLQCGDVRLILMEPRSDKSEVAKFLRLHPEGISHVNFQVRDLDHACKVIEEHDGTFIDFPVTEKADGTTYRHAAITTPLGDVIFRFVEVQGDPNIVPGMQRIADFRPDYNPLGITGIDHLTSNTRTLFPLISFYEHVLGLERFWNVQFHTDDLKPGSGSGLKSIVVWDPESGKIKLANNEPLRPRFDLSQIQIYVDDNRGPGIQHIAFHVSDIIKTVEHCRANGIEFLPTPKTYYEMVPERIEKQKMGKIAEPLSELERLSILIDGKDGGYLLQIFCKDQASQFGRPDAGPLFIEIIQRCGHDGFGEGNFRALFESIERQQMQQLAGTKS